MENGNEGKRQSCNNKKERENLELDASIVLKVQDFVKQYNSREIIVDSISFGFDLANAIHDFEMSEPSDNLYSYKVSEVNRLISQVIGHHQVYDNKDKNKLLDIENKYNELKTKLEEKNTIIEGLKTERDYWHGRYDTLAKYVPLPKQESFEGDVSDQ